MKKKLFTKKIIRTTTPNEVIVIHGHRFRVIEQTFNFDMIPTTLDGQTFKSHTPGMPRFDIKLRLMGRV